MRNVSKKYLDLEKQSNNSEEHLYWDIKFYKQEIETMNNVLINLQNDDEFSDFTNKLIPIIQDDLYFCEQMLILKQNRLEKFKNEPDENKWL